MGANFCDLKGERLRLLYQKAIFWESESCLLVSDLHLGKGHHFSKGGIPLPKSVDSQNLLKLKSLLEVLKPATLLFLGDLFHSEANAHVDEACKFFARYPDIRKVLVAGNHDIMEAHHYASMGLEVYEESLALGPFLLSHDRLPDDACGGLYNLSGHIHPGVRLRGKARQSVMLPCFYFGEKAGVLPAFGNMTGLYPIQPVAGERVFAVLERSVVELS